MSSVPVLDGRLVFPDFRIEYIDSEGKHKGRKIELFTSLEPDLLPFIEVNGEADDGRTDLGYLWLRGNDLKAPASSVELRTRSAISLAMFSPNSAI